MLAFPDQADLSEWIQAHLVTTSRCKCDGVFQPYSVVDSHEEFNPDMRRCWGWDQNNQRCYISDAIPLKLRPLIIQMERRRILRIHQQSHDQAVRQTLDAMPRSAMWFLLRETLATFYEDLCLHFEHGDQTRESTDAAAALQYLRSLA